MISSNRSDIQVSLSHDERICLTVAGYGSQGCDIEPVKTRTHQEWLALLGNGQQVLLQELMAGHDSLDIAGTRIWVALESLLKTQSSPQITNLTIDHRNGEDVIFRTNSGKLTQKILTFPIKFTKGTVRVVALAVSPSDDSSGLENSSLQTSTPLTIPSEADFSNLLDERVVYGSLSPNVDRPKRKKLQGLIRFLKHLWQTIILILRREFTDWSYYRQEKKRTKILSQLGYDPTVYGIRGEITDTGHLVFIYRFPLTFKANANLSGSVYFSHYLTWMGGIRELAMYPVHDHIVADFTVGNWGMVTNYSQIRFFSESHKNDVLEVRLWMGDITGPTQSTFCLYYDWCRVLGNGRLERVALGEVQLTWVEVLAHGVVKTEPFPLYFQDFLNQRISPSNRPLNLSPQPEPWRDLHWGLELYRLSNPQTSQVLYEQTFVTSLEDSNLVGNIYFSNYYVWQGRVRDNFFYTQIPNAFRGRGEQGEFLCLFSRVKHLREAMPFEKILVTMTLQTLFECGMELMFEYFRLTDRGERQKIARGQHEVIWARRFTDGSPVPTALPPSLRSFLLHSVNSDS